MSRQYSHGRVVRALAAVAAGGSLFLGIPSCETALKVFNPCANIFEFCDPNDIDLAFATIPDYDLDPTCTIPYLQGCSAGNIFPDSFNRP